MIGEIKRLCSLKMIKCYQKNEEVAKEVNQYFGHIIDSLDLYEFPYEKICEELDNIGNIVCNFKNNPSIVKIKERYKVKDNFSFILAMTKEIKAIVRDIFLHIKEWG